MGNDILQMTEEYLSDDPLRWGKLASDMTYRRFEVLLLREILVELRKLNESGTQAD